MFLTQLWPLLLSLARADEASSLYADVRRWRPLRTADGPPSIPESAYRAALSGAPADGVELDGQDSGKGWAMRVLASPIEAVWKAATDVDRLAAQLPVKVGVALENPHRNNMLVFQYIDLPLVTDRWWCVRQRYNAPLYAASAGRAWEVAWTDEHGQASCAAERLPAVSAEGMSMRFSRGAWMLIDLGGGRTLVEYHSWSHPGGSLPADQVLRFSAGQLSKVLDAIGQVALYQQRTSDAGFYRPDGTPL